MVDQTTNEEEFPSRSTTESSGDSTDPGLETTSLTTSSTNVQSSLSTTGSTPGESGTNDDGNNNQDGETNGGGGESSSTPVGVIVGGAIGGAAFIALVVFGVWYMLFLQRKARRREEGEEFHELAARGNAPQQLPANSMDGKAASVIYEAPDDSQVRSELHHDHVKAELPGSTWQGYSMQ